MDAHHLTARRYLVVPPTEPVVSTNEAKAQLGITGATKDSLITTLVAAASQQLDPASGGWLGRALRPQTWELRAPSFPVVGIPWDWARIHPVTWPGPRLPYPPLTAVDAVSYVRDSDGSTVTLTAGVDYRVMGVGLQGGGWVEPVYGGEWPSGVRTDSESVRVRFTCGYPTSKDNLADGLPAAIKQAVVLMVRQMMDWTGQSVALSEISVEGVGSRRYVLSQDAAAALQRTAENLVMPFRVYE